MNQGARWRPAHGRAEHADHVPREPLEGVRLLEPLGAHDLRHQTDLRGKHETEAEAVDGLERDDRRDPTDVPEHADSRQRLRRPLHERRADEDEVARDPVGKDTTCDDDERLDPLPDREHEAERRGRGDVEHGERERDPCEPVADRGDRRAGEEQAEVSLPQRSEPLREGHRHGRTLDA